MSYATYTVHLGMHFTIHADLIGNLERGVGGIHMYEENDRGE